MKGKPQKCIIISVVTEVCCAFRCSLEKKTGGSKEVSSIFGEQGEKKVEYLELIYDLIFVYLIGRNNSLLQAVHNGFVPADRFLTYILCTLIIIQIWSITTLFINRYGTNGVQEHIALFVNMYLLYFMADGTRLQWQSYYLRYNLAWGLIMANLTLQHWLKYKASARTMPWVLLQIRHQTRMLLIMTLIIFVSIPVYFMTGIPLSPLAMVYGIAASVSAGDINRLVSVDFAHLTERIMLYVVFTFGEMIIGIAGYFSDSTITWNTIYFSLMAFLIVVGLFLSYGFVYDHIIDRELSTNGTVYMFLHIFLITAQNFITAGMEFMQEPAVAAIPKNIFLTASFLMYFFCLSQSARFARFKPMEGQKIYRNLLIRSLVFILLMALTYRSGAASIAVSVLYIYGVFWHLYSSWKKSAAS